MQPDGQRERIGRRRWLAAAACGAAAGWRPVRAAALAEQVLRLGIASGARSANGAAAQAFADALAQRSGGRFAIELFGHGGLGNEPELLEAVRLGVVPLALVSVLTLAVSAPEIGVFAIPFLFHDVAQARRAVDGPAGSACLDCARAAGVIPLGWSEDGVRHVTTATAPVRRPADLRGLRLAVPQSDAEILGFRGLGAAVTVVARDAVAAALEGGHVHAQEDTLDAVLAGELWRVQPFLSLTAHVVAPALLIAAPPFWSGLGPDDQAIFQQAAHTATQAARAVRDAADRDAIDRLRGLGMTVVEDVDHDAFAAAVDPESAAFVRLFGRARIAALRAVD